MTIPLCQPADASRDGTEPRAKGWWPETHNAPPDPVYGEAGYWAPIPDNTMMTGCWFWHRYTSAEIAALVAAATDALGQLYLLDVEHSGLTAALAPFQPMGDADG